MNHHIIIEERHFALLVTTTTTKCLTFHIDRKNIILPNLLDRLQILPLLFGKWFSLASMYFYFIQFIKNYLSLFSPAPHHDKGAQAMPHNWRLPYPPALFRIQLWHQATTNLAIS